MSCLHYKNNELYVENCSLNKIAEKFGTPCYVYSRAEIEKNWRSFNAAFSEIPHQICYAVKANSNIAILNILATLKSGFDIVSVGELERVLAAEGDPKKIVFSGVGKTEAEIARAIAVGIACIDVESEPELTRIQEIAARLNKKMAIALRINPDVNPNTHAHISTGLKENKFGIELSEVIPLCQKISSMPNLELTGLACHIGSQITDIQPFVLAIDSMLAVYEELKNLGFKLNHLNIGGGLGITYRDEQPPSIRDYAKVLRDKVAQQQVTTIIEPGRSIVGNAGILLTKIEYLKHTNHRNFAIVDAGMNDLLRPALYNAWQDILPTRLKSSEKKCYDIAGPVCESADFLGKDRMLAIAAGDYLAVDSAGAYGFSMSSNYNSRCKPAEVLVEGNAMHLIRHREDIKELFAPEQIPWRK